MADSVEQVRRWYAEELRFTASYEKLEFLIDRVARLPTRKEQALKPLYQRLAGLRRLQRAIDAALELAVERDRFVVGEG